MVTPSRVAIQIPLDGEHLFYVWSTLWNARDLIYADVPVQDGIAELQSSSTGQVARKSFAGYECAKWWPGSCLIKVVTVITSGFVGWQNSGVSGGKWRKFPSSGVKCHTQLQKRCPRQREATKTHNSRLKFAVFQFQFKFTSMFHFIWPTV